MDLLKTIDVMDVVFNKAYDESSIYFRMDSSIVAIEKSSGELLWEYDIKYSSPVGTHLIWVSNEFVVYGAIDSLTNYQVFGVLNKKGEKVKVIKTPNRVYEEGVNSIQKKELEFLSFNEGKRYYCSLDIELAKVNEVQEIENVVDSVFIENKNLFLSGGDGVFKVLQNNIKKVYNENVFRFIKFEKQVWIIEELKESNLFGVKKWNKTDDLIFSFEVKGLQKSIFSSIKISENLFFISFEEFGGINCYDLVTGKLLWNFGENEITVNSYTIVNNHLIIIAQNQEYDIKTFVLDNTKGILKKEIHSNVEPEYITNIDGHLYISGLLGIEIYALSL